MRETEMHTWLRTGQPEGTRPLWGPRHKWWDNIKNGS